MTARLQHYLNRRVKIYATHGHV